MGEIIRIEQTADLSQHGSVIEVEDAHAAVAEASHKPPQRPVKAHGRHGDRKFGSVGQNAHARHELDDAFAAVDVPHRHDRRLVGAH